MFAHDFEYVNILPFLEKDSIENFMLCSKNIFKNVFNCNSFWIEYLLRSSGFDPNKYKLNLSTKLPVGVENWYLLAKFVRLIKRPHRILSMWEGFEVDNKNLRVTIPQADVTGQFFYFVVKKSIYNPYVLGDNLLFHLALDDEDPTLVNAFITDVQYYELNVAPFKSKPKLPEELSEHPEPEEEDSGIVHSPLDPFDKSVNLGFGSYADLYNYINERSGGQQYISRGLRFMVEYDPGYTMGCGLRVRYPISRKKRFLLSKIRRFCFIVGRITGVKGPVFPPDFQMLKKRKIKEYSRADFFLIDSRGGVLSSKRVLFSQKAMEDFPGVTVPMDPREKIYAMIGTNCGDTIEANYGRVRPLKFPVLADEDYLTKHVVEDDRPMLVYAPNRAQQ